MKDKVVKFGYFSGGAVLGSMIGALICKKYYGNKAREEVGEIRKFYDKKLEELNLTGGQEQNDTKNEQNATKMLQKSVTNEGDDGEKDDEDPEKHFKKLVSEINPEEMRGYRENDLRQTYDTRTARTEEDDFEDLYELEREMAETEHPDDDGISRIFTIKADQYGDLSSQEMKEVTFYKRRTVFIDDKTNEKMDPWYHFGSKLMEFMTKTEEEYVYIRNTKSGFDYEISIVEDDFDA